MQACVLVRALPGKVLKVLEGFRAVKGVVRAFLVYGRYDIVVFVEAADYDSVKRISGEINTLKGVKSTETAIEG